MCVNLPRRHSSGKKHSHFINGKPCFKHNYVLKSKQIWKIQFDTMHFVNPQIQSLSCRVSHDPPVLHNEICHKQQYRLNNTVFTITSMSLN